MKTPPKSTQLQASMKFWSPGSELWGAMSSRAAEAIMPMTTGRIPFMAPSTSGLLCSLRKKRVSRSMSVSEGRLTAKVAMKAPSSPNHGLPASMPTE